MISRLIPALCCVALALASIDQKNKNYPGEDSRQYRRSCAALDSIKLDDSFLGPFIVHLEEPHTHEEFENSVRNLQNDQYPFTSSAVKVRTFIRFSCAYLLSVQMHFKRIVRDRKTCVYFCFSVGMMFFLIFIFSFSSFSFLSFSFSSLLSIILFLILFLLCESSSLLSLLLSRIFWLL